MAAYGVDLKAAGFFASQTPEPFRAFLNDGRNGCQRLDVIDYRGAAIETLNRRKGWLQARIAALTFERIE